MSPIRFDIVDMNGVTERFVKYRILVVGAGPEGVEFADSCPLYVPAYTYAMYAFSL